MNAYSIAPDYVVNAPNEFIRQFASPQNEKPNIIIDTEAIKMILKGFISMLESYYVELLKLSPSEAKAILKGTQTPPNPSQDSIIQENQIPVDEEFKEYLFTLADLTINVHNRLSLIANRGKIDENSPEYQHFLADMANDITSKEESNKVFGKKSLLALFD